MKKLLLILSAVFLTYPLFAGEISGDLYLTTTSKYLWRGQVLYNDVSLQPGADIGYKGFSLGFWGNYAIPDNEMTEADILAGYSHSFDKLTLSAGFTYYTFPSVDSTSMEASISAGFDVLLSPYVTIYYDFGDGDGAYIEAGINYDAEGKPVPVSITMTIGYNAGQWGFDPSLTVLAMNVAFPFQIKSFTITPAIFSQIALDNQYENDGAASLTIEYAW